MSAQFNAQSILDATGGRIIFGQIPDTSGSICGDIRELKAGQWFIALPDTTADGHDYLEEAMHRGAIGCVVVDCRQYPFAAPNSLLIGVSSTLQAYYELAKVVRRRVNPKVIAITGSSGKSTTRDMCSSILSLKFRTHASLSYRPDARSLAMTLLTMPETTEVLVAELAQRGRGQISWLGAMIAPDIAVITNIGLAHLDTLGSIENIAAAKCELLECLSRDSGTAILGDGNPHLLKRAERVFESDRTLVLDENNLEAFAVTPETTVFVLSGSDTLFELKAHGSGYLRDAWCAVACGRVLGMSDFHIAQGLHAYTAPRGRGNKVIGVSGALIIDESYSATPESVRAAVTAFLDKRAVPHSRKYIVLGEMQELGDASDGIHSKVGQWLSELHFDGLVTIGTAAANIARGARNAGFETFTCTNAIEAYNLLSSKLDETTSVLVDGSDSTELRAVIKLLVSSRIAKLSPGTKSKNAVKLSHTGNFLIA